MLPRHDNHDRPYVLRHGSLAAVSALLLAVKVLTIGLIGLTPAQADLSTITVNRILQLTNEERVQEGLSPLKTTSRLMQAATLKGQDMLEQDYFAHISPTGVTPWFWMAKTGYVYKVAGENLAIDFIEAEDVVAAWIASPSHRQNMLRSDYTETGVAVVTGEFDGGQSTIVVHMFSLPAGSPPAGGVAAQTTSATPTPTPAPAKATAVSTPTPTPAASPTPSATPLPAPVETEPPRDTTPPRVPRISTPDGSTSVQEHVQFFIEGEAGSTVHLVVDDAPVAHIPLSAQGKAIYSLDVSEFREGEFTVRGYASDDARNDSALSEPLTLIKDTQAPGVAREEVSFFVSPLTEAADIVLQVPNQAGINVRLAQGLDVYQGVAGSFVRVPSITEPLTVAVADEAGNTKILPEFSVFPQFNTIPSQHVSSSPAKFASLGRQLTATVLVVIMMLLILAVVIRIRIQHPDLITHASFVILLAGVLLVL